MSLKRFVVPRVAPMLDVGVVVVDAVVVDDAVVEVEGEAGVAGLDETEAENVR
jgi:hypothetical protein